MDSHQRPIPDYPYTDPFPPLFREPEPEPPRRWFTPGVHLVYYEGLHKVIERRGRTYDIHHFREGDKLFATMVDTTSENYLAKRTRAEHEGMRRATGGRGYTVVTVTPISAARGSFHTIEFSPPLGRPGDGARMRSAEAEAERWERATKYEAERAYRAEARAEAAEERADKAEALARQLLRVEP